jgi:MFS family permease
MSPLWLGVLAFAAVAAYTVSMRSSHWVREKLGTKRALSLGLGVLGVATFLVPSAQNMMTLYFLHACMGTGLGIIYPILMSLSIEQETTSYSQTEAMGIFQSVYAVGIATGPFLSGQLAETFGIKSVFLINGVVVIISLVFTQLLFKQNGNL